MIPDWWEAVILGLAAWRVFHLLAFDDILNVPRNYISGLSQRATSRAGGREKVMEFIECPYCFGFWIALAWWGAWYIWPHETLVAGVPFMLSAALVAAHTFLSSD